MYKALLGSHLRYADLVWGSLSNTKIRVLQRLENRAFDNIQASKIQGSLIRPIFSTDQMFQFHWSVLKVKIINKVCLESLHDKFAEKTSISKYDTRKGTDLQVAGLNLDCRRKIFN